MKRWYLVYCKRGDQERAKLHLENQGVECYYPTIEVEKIRRGKRILAVEPMFPSYVFIRFDFELGPSFTTIRSTRGIVDFVRVGLKPQEVQPEVIQELHLLEFNSDDQAYQSLPKKGDVVRINAGQFSGIDAIYQEKDGEKRSIMLVKMISQMVPVSVDNTHLEVQ